MLASWVAGVRVLRWVSRCSSVVSRASRFQRHIRNLHSLQLVRKAAQRLVHAVTSN